VPVHISTEAIDRSLDVDESAPTLTGEGEKQGEGAPPVRCLAPLAPKRNSCSVYLDIRNEN